MFERSRSCRLVFCICSISYVCVFLTFSFSPLFVLEHTELSGDVITSMGLFLRRDEEREENDEKGGR